MATPWEPPGDGYYVMLEVDVSGFLRGEQSRVLVTITPVSSKASHRPRSEDDKGQWLSGGAEESVRCEEDGSAVAGQITPSVPGHSDAVHGNEEGDGLSSSTVPVSAKTYTVLDTELANRSRSSPKFEGLRNWVPETSPSSALSSPLQDFSPQAVAAQVFQGLDAGRGMLAGGLAALVGGVESVVQQGGVTSSTGSALIDLVDGEDGAADEGSASFTHRGSGQAEAGGQGAASGLPSWVSGSSDAREAPDMAPGEAAAARVAPDFGEMREGGHGGSGPAAQNGGQGSGRGGMDLVGAGLMTASQDKGSKTRGRRRSSAVGSPRTAQDGQTVARGDSRQSDKVEVAPGSVTAVAAVDGGSRVETRDERVERLQREAYEAADALREALSASRITTSQAHGQDAPFPRHSLLPQGGQSLPDPSLTSPSPASAAPPTCHSSSAFPNQPNQQPALQPYSQPHPDDPAILRPEESNFVAPGESDGRVQQHAECAEPQPASGCKAPLEWHPDDLIESLWDRGSRDLCRHPREFPNARFLPPSAEDLAGGAGGGEIRDGVPGPMLVTSVSKIAIEQGPRALQQDFGMIEAVPGRVPVICICDGHGSVSMLQVDQGKTPRDVRNMVHVGGAQAAEIGGRAVMDYVRSNAAEFQLKEAEAFFHRAFVHAHHSVLEELRLGSREGEGSGAGLQSGIDGSYFKNIDRLIVNLHASRATSVARKVTRGNATFYQRGNGSWVHADFGTTCTAVAILNAPDEKRRNRKVVVTAHAGDSDACLMRFSKPAHAGQKSVLLFAHWLTQEHTLLNPKERARPIREGKVLADCEGVGSLKNKVRVNVTLPNGEGSGVAYEPTRGLGHCEAQFAGIVPAPTVSCAEVEAEDIVIVGTDGLWTALGGRRPSGYDGESQQEVTGPLLASLRNWALRHRNLDVQQMSAELMGMARARGLVDNVCLAVAKVSERPADTSRLRTEDRAGRPEGSADGTGLRGLGRLFTL